MLLWTVLFFLSSFSLDGPSELSQSEAEGFHQEGEKSTQTRPDEQLPTNDFAPVSKCWPRKVRNLYCIRLSYESLFSNYSITQWLELVPAWVGQNPGKHYRQDASSFYKSKIYFRHSQFACDQNIVFLWLQNNYLSPLHNPDFLVMKGR